MLHDLSLAIKHLRRSPLFVVVAVVTLGLGIGISTTMLTMLDTIRHPYVPYRDVERLYQVGMKGTLAVPAIERFRALTANTTSFEGVAANIFLAQRSLVEALGNATQVQLTGVTGNYFPLLGMRPEMGRFFIQGLSGPDEDKAVVSYAFWQQMLSSREFDQGIPITVDGRTYTVIGVMPAELTGAEIVVRVPEVAGLPVDQRRNITPIVRLKPGVTEETAYAELKIIESRLLASFAPGKSFQFRLFPMKPDPRALSDFQVAMVGAAFAVLLIACANMANLMLVRGLSRRKEMALRLAVGGTRRHLIRQFMSESAVVGLLGGGLGTLVAVWGVGLVRYHLPTSGRWLGFLAPRLDWRVFAFAMGVTGLATLAFGLLPAFTASDVKVSDPLKDASATSSSRTKHRYSALVVAEVGICLVVLMAAGLMVRQLDQFNAYAAERGGQGVLQGTVVLDLAKLPKGTSLERHFENVSARFLSVPGVLDVAVSGAGSGAEGAITSDFEDSIPRFIVGGAYSTVSANYVQVMGRRVIEGRDFEPGDRFTSAAMVDEYMAYRLWPGVSPVGRMVKLGGPRSRAPWVRVVGLLRSPRIQPNMYGIATGELLVMTRDSMSTRKWFAVRANANSAIVGNALNRALRDLFPPGAMTGGYFFDYDQMRRDSQRPFAFITNLFAGLGGLSLLLAAVGMYGVLAYSVGQRMREFGIRIALGAGNRSVFQLVLHDAAVMILAGTAIGAWFAMWAGGMMVSEETSMIPPTDWIALASGEIILLLTCFAACMAPAIKASRANPLDIIRAI